MTDQLVEINPKDLQNLKTLYTPDGLKSYIAYMTIDNYIRWFEQNPNVKHIKFFSLNGDFSDGTFVVTDLYVAYADTFNESYDRLTRLLQLIDYSKGYTFLTVRPDLQPVIKDALKQINIGIMHENATLLYHLAKEEALKFDVQPPDGIELRIITEQKDIEKAHSVWPHSSSTTLQFFHRMAKYNTNIGAYTDDGTFVAWLFRLPTGLLGALQTDENYYGKGYGSLVTRYLSKKIAEMGHDIYGGIFEANTPSRSLFGKLGFKSIGEVFWITTNVTCPPADDSTS